MKEAHNAAMISCICPTYGRPVKYQHLLEEAIESFLRQDYPEKELIVVNDTPGQLLRCDSEGVHVINVDGGHLPTLGDKYNRAVEESKGRFICSWDDDDISLSHRLSSSIKRIKDNAYFNPRRYWFIEGNNRLHHEHPCGYAHNAAMYTRDAWEEVGGYRKESGPQDAHMDADLRALGRTSEIPDLPITEWSYIYRWGVSPCHLSAHITGTGPDRNAQKVYDNMQSAREYETGSFTLKPHFVNDYEAMCRDHICEHGLK